jgi:uncharacterized membrane protein YkvA (DUF1232 family)
LLRDLRLLGSLAKDYWRGTYREVSLSSMLLSAAALIYTVSPIDFVSDFIPVLGWIDDTLILLTCLYFLERELDKYEAWKKKQ